jgi:hypothetical protein
MGALIIVAALAAQAATTGGSPSTTSTSTDSTAPKVNAGETNYVDLEAGAGYSSNPQLSVANDQGSAFGRVSLHAVHSRVSARSTTLLSAYAENISYTNHYGSQQSVNVYGRHDAAVSEHARLFIDGNASYQEGGQLDTVVLGLPITPPTVPAGPLRRRS